MPLAWLKASSYKGSASAEMAIKRDDHAFC